MNIFKSTLRDFCEAAQAVGLLNLNEALVEAAHKGQSERVQALLDGGANVHFEHDNALWKAAESGHTETAKVLLANKASINPVKEQWCVAPLFAAAAEGHLDTVELLLKNGADVHVGDDMPLIAASKRAWPRVVQTLLDGGADVHAQNGLAAKVALSRDVPCIVYERGDITEKESKDTLKALRRAGARVPKELHL